MSKYGPWTLKFTVSQELIDFLHPGTNSCKLKANGLSGHGQKRVWPVTVSQNLTDEITWFFAC